MTELQERTRAEMQERIRVLELRNQKLEDRATYRESLLERVQKLCQQEAAAKDVALDRVEELESHVAELEDMLEESRTEVRRLAFAVDQVADDKTHEKFQPLPPGGFVHPGNALDLETLPGFPLTVADNPPPDFLH